MEFTSSDEITHSQKMCSKLYASIRTPYPPKLVLHFDFRFDVDRFCLKPEKRRCIWSVRVRLCQQT
jgi:hypothetical protein